MATVEELSVKITADVKNAISGINSVMSSSIKAGKGITKSFGALSASIAGVTAKFGSLGVAVIGSVGSFLTLSKAVNELNDAMGISKWTKTLGISTQAFTELDFVARQFNITTDDLGDSMKDLNERIADAALDQTATYSDALRKLNLEASDLLKLPMEEQYIKTMTALGKLTTQSEKNFVAAELMAESGFRVIRMADNAEEAFGRMRKEARELGASLTDIDLAKLEGTNVILAKLGASFDAVFKKGIVSIAPNLYAIGASVIDLIKKFGGIEGVVSILIGKFNEFANKVGRAFVYVQDKILSVKVALLAIKTLAIISSQSIVASAQEIGNAYDKYWTKPAMDAIAKVQGFFGVAEKDQAKFVKSSGDAQRAVLASMQEDIEALMTKMRELSQQGIELNIEADKDNGGIGSLIKSLLGEEPMAQIEAFMENYKERLAEFNEELAEIDEENKSKQIGRQETTDDLMLRKKQAYLRSLKQQETQQNNESKWLWESGYKGKLQISKSFFANLSSLMDTSNRKAFEIGKAAAITSAIIDTYMAANKAMASVPYPFNFAAAASTIAAGFVNVNKIRSQSFGSGGGASGGSSASALSSSSASSSETASTSASSQTTREVTQFNIALSGSIYSNEQVDELIGQINDRTSDNVELKTTR